MYPYRAYKIVVTATISTAISILEYTAPANRLAFIVEAWLDQETSEVSQQENVAIVRKSGVGTGSSFTPLPLSPNQGAAGGTARITITAEGTVSETPVRQAFNVLNGWRYAPLPESRLWIAPSGIVALKFITAPTSQTWSAGLVFAEVG